MIGGPGHNEHLYPMKIFITGLLFTALLGNTAIAQKKNPSSMKDIKDRQKEAMAEYDKLSPEQKKMLGQMGIQMPDASSNPVLSGKISDDAIAEELSDIPKKDEARIKSIPAAALDNNSMPAYISNTHKKVYGKMKAEEKHQSEMIWTELKSINANAAAVGNVASVFWMAGQLEPAVLLMGRALNEDPLNTDNLNNYAAMLTMLQGEPMAIPILNALNKKFPGNSTVLNNLGQAWFSLGDLDKAGMYLDSAMLKLPFHPMACYTKSFIEESKGNPTKAIDLVKKSMQSSVSAAKENRLRKLGYKLQLQDIKLPFKSNPDPLGLNNFKHPAYPENAQTEYALREEWKSYLNAVNEKAIAIQKRLNAVIQPQVQKSMKDAQAAFDKYQKGGVSALKSTSAGVKIPFSRRAEIKLRLLQGDKAFQSNLTKMEKDLLAYKKQRAPLAEEYYKAFIKLDYKQASQMGEGLANCTMCSEFNALVNKYYKAVRNVEYTAIFDNYLRQLRLKLNEEIFWKQFVMSKEEFEAEVMHYQLAWLKAQMLGVYIGYNEAADIKVTAGICALETPKSGGKLADFNSLHCMIKSELNFPIGKIKIECGKMFTEFSLGPVKYSMIQDMDQVGKYEGMGDDFVSCNVEVTAGKKLDTKLGPVSAEIGVEGSIGVEITKNGIEDVYVTAGAKAGFGTNVIDQMEKDNGTKYGAEGVGITDRSIDIGAEGRISIITGKTSFSGLQSNVLK